MPMKRQRLKENSRLLPDHAIQVMNDWYNKHYANPYPTYREFEKMAREGSISVSQVKQWFVNVRRRTKNEYRKRRMTVNKTNSVEVEKFLQDICAGQSMVDSSDSSAMPDQLNDTQNDIDADTHDSSSWASFSPQSKNSSVNSSSSNNCSTSSAALTESPQIVSNYNYNDDNSNLIKEHSKNVEYVQLNVNQSPGSSNDHYRGFFYHYYASAGSSPVVSSLNSSLKSPEFTNSPIYSITTTEHQQSSYPSNNYQQINQNSNTTGSYNNYSYNNHAYLNNQCYYYNNQQSFYTTNYNAYN